MSVLWISLALVTLLRAATLLRSAWNTPRLLQQGGIEAGAAQFPLIALLQAAWLVSMAVLIPAATPPNRWLLGACALVELAHLWVILTLGRYWTTRVIVIPGAPLVRRGAYRFLRHPNYVAVLAEIALLPLAFHAHVIAIVFFVLYAALVIWRVRDEDRLLALGRRA